MIHGTLFCSDCDDVVYDARFTLLHKIESARSSVRRLGDAALDAMMENEAVGADGKRLAPICRGAWRCGKRLTPVPRGLRNMGSTCFLNVILQSFLHNPLLRNYFLSDRHNAALCSLGKECLACEMDKLFAEFYARSHDQGPYGPTSFLYSIWMDSSSAELSQTGQHDAQEMLISALNGIHASLTGNALARTRLPHFPLDDADVQMQLYAHSDRAYASAGDDKSERITDHGASCPCASAMHAGAARGGSHSAQVSRR